ncbi:DUF5320 family protein [Candidatus Dojkabacteria bacterium]|nr:DUF5320 family protein [Candidatus Dojkabacteria bacterium]
MPNLDKTGPLGKGPFTGRGRGRGLGSGSGARGVGAGRGLGVGGRRQGGNKECTCPKCGYSESQTRGIPCTEKKCPKCQTPMRGVYCL